MHSRDNSHQNSGTRQVDRTSDASGPSDGRTNDLREANENIRKARGEDATDTPVDTNRTGNRPRFDRDR